MKAKIIAETGQSVIVEWYDGNTQRAIVPAAVVHGDSVDDVELAAGVAYGVPWEETTTPAIAAELRRVGIWTGRDLAEHPQVATAAIQRVIGISLAALRRAAQEFESGGTK
jgi:hypothetical protein